MRGVYEKDKGSGVWYIRYSGADGRKHREKAGKRSIAVALYRKRKTEALERRKLPELHRRSAKFRELADDALAWSEQHKRSYRDDRLRMKKLLVWFGDREASTIRPHDIEWHFTHKLSGRAPGTVNRYRALLSLVYRLAVEGSKVPSNPVRLTKARQENNGRVRYLTLEEEADLRHHFAPVHWPELDIALHTGLRQGEQYGLRWSDVDLERRIVTVRRSKHGKPRHVPLNDVAVEAFQSLRKLTTGERVFWTQRPRHWFEPAVAKSGIQDFKWHDLRHTFASRLAMAGVHLLVIKDLMGHSSLTMVMRYAHLSPEFHAEAVAKLKGGTKSGTGGSKLP